MYIPAPKDQKQSKILEALAKLEGGSAFTEVAKAYSEDKARSGGDLGWLVRQTGTMEPIFQEQAFSATIGQYTQPFKGSNGYHIILVEERQ